MDEEQQQSSRQYSYQMITFPNTTPQSPPGVPGPHNQATMQCGSVIHPAQEMSRDNILAPQAPPADPASYYGPHHMAHTAYYGPHHMGYEQYNAPITLSDGVTHRQTSCAPQPTVASTQLYGRAAASANGPPFFDIPLTENPHVLSAGYNPAVPGKSMTSIYRDLAVRFVNDPRSNITMIRMESSTGRSRVVIELDAA